MNKDIKEIKERLQKIEEIVSLKYGSRLRNPIECCIDFDIKLRPRIPTTATEAVYLQGMETRLKYAIHTEVSRIEEKINEYLSCMV